jgi:hypothetical protein|tara:strand:- start:432 stop:1226 length:795 start_codon:yes stop_codon:yes gene_type:complete
MLNIHSFRRGQVFNFTLTELILLLLFILLLLLWFISDKKDKESAEWQKITTEWQKITGASTPEVFRDLYPNFPDKTTAPDLQDQLIAAKKKIKKLTNEIDQLKIGDEGLGRNPPCWPKNWPNNPDYEKSDRIFNILMIDKNHLAVIPDYNKQIYSEQYMMLRLDQSIFSTNEDFKNNTLKLISKEKFKLKFQPLLEDSKKSIDLEHNNLTLRRDCRHEVRLFLENEAINTREYINLKQKTVEYIFTNYAFDIKYMDYLKEFKND